MTAYEIGSLIVSGLAFVLSIVATIIGLGANKKTDKQAKVGTLNNIFVNIDAARGRMEDHVAQMAQLSSRKNLAEAEESQLAILTTVLDSKIEGLLNAYDDACQHLLAGDVDQTAFKGKYLHSVKELVEKYPVKFQDPVTRFRNIVAVYKKWYS